MPQAIRVGLIGGGWPGGKHAEGYKAAGGFELAAVADLIPARRKKLIETFGNLREYSDATELLKDVQIDAVSVCLPNALHAPIVLAALKAGKHVICETPPTISAGEARKLASAATKAGKVLTYAFQRRFGGPEQAAAQAIQKGYIGNVQHVRASWMRTRSVPAGSDWWYLDNARSGGGVVMDLGVQMLDLAWHLMGQPRPTSVYAITNRRFRDAAPAEVKYDVEDAASILMRFDGDKSLELDVTWAINQPPRRQGTVCRLHADQGAIEVYTPHGPVLYRKFGAKGEANEAPLKTPKVIGYHAMMRNFRACIAGTSKPVFGAGDGVALMQMIEAIYKSAASGKSVEIRGGRENETVEPSV
ncbi:MAG TPA: Gfo/Idh/MocA family oxidoreductase [Humisphaera sp.]|jgi:predicted dehydrogenase|nr:Gfo/Idh/MocA family oxidoreductase [Humisphaera sp.]